VIVKYVSFLEEIDGTAVLLDSTERLAPHLDTRISAFGQDSKPK
jgi:hypothetical protein